jgi:hypothetical protein
LSVSSDILNRRQSLIQPVSRFIVVSLLLQDLLLCAKCLLCGANRASKQGLVEGDFLDDARRDGLLGVTELVARRTRQKR